ncbi:MAG TPA: hypothetical protein VIL69_04355 [Roseomonas sp.]|jgi:hypothetical protein
MITQTELDRAVNKARTDAAAFAVPVGVIVAASAYFLSDYLPLVLGVWLAAFAYFTISRVKVDGVLIQALIADLVDMRREANRQVLTDPAVPGTAYASENHRIEMSAETLVSA